jgi:adenosine deaminase
MKSNTTDLSQFIRDMPKAEIHLHLEGAIQPETVLKLAQHNKLTNRLPSTDLNTLKKWFTFTDFPHFVRIYVTIQDLIRTPDDFALIAYECGADMAAQNIRYRECTVTPYTHTDFQDKGLTIADILTGLNAGREKARQEFGVEMRWVFDIPRNLSFKEEDGRYNPHPAERTLEFAVDGRSQGVVGFGLGGYEVGAPPEPFAHAFVEAKQAGLLSVPHAGETEGANSVWGAVRVLQADRSGHGVRSVEDESLVALLRERQIPLEINPTSNQCLHVYALADHPFRQLDDMGLLVTVNSDDPPLFNTSLCQEYEVLASEFGYDQAGLVRVARNAFVVAGVETAVKTHLLDEFDNWVDQYERA